jgi:putative ABC transport system permease protein
VRLGIRELRRRPGRFAGAGFVLLFVSLLLVFLGGLVDGLNASNDSAIRAQPGELVVFAATADRAIPQSVVGAEERRAVESVDGVDGVGGLDLVQLGARLPERGPRDLVDVAVVSHELPVDGAEPLPTGRVWADDILLERGVRAGMTVRLGPARTPVVVEGFLDGTGYQGQGTLWAGRSTFDEVVADNAAGDRLAAGASRVLTVGVEGSTDAEAVAAAIDAATGGATETVTRRQAADAVLDIGGGVLTVIVGLTVAIAVLVVTLFFALLTLERAPLFGVLKAIGARTRTLFAGTLAQAAALAGLAGLVAVAAGFAADAALPPGSIPFRLSAGRAAQSIGQLLLAAVLGSLLCLRRIARTDPATTIGRNG